MRDRHVGLRPVLFPLVVASFAACGSLPSDPVDGLEVTTDHFEYPIGGLVEVTVRNLGDADAYLSHCNARVGFAVEERRGAGWDDAFGIDTVCPAIYQSGLDTLPAGGSYQRHIVLDHAGVYRLRLNATYRTDATKWVPVHSNAFVLGG